MRKEDEDVGQKRKSGRGRRRIDGECTWLRRRRGGALQLVYIPSYPIS